MSSAQSVMHVHTICGTVLSAQAAGLLPINQFASTCSGKIGYHDHEGPGLRLAEQTQFIADLDGRPLMFISDHGTLKQGRSIAEAFTLMRYLERTCEIQVPAQSGGAALATPAKAVIDPTVATAQGVGDRSFGDVGFQAMLRRIDRADPSYHM